MEYPKMNGNLISLINECLMQSGKKLIVVEIDDKEEEPLNCPFCNEKPSIEESEYCADWDVICTNEDCKIQPSLHDYYTTKQEAVRAWNSRN